MSNDENMICKEFEREVYLYLGNDLSAERKEHWKQHVANCKICSSLISEIEIVLDQAREELVENLPDAKFKTMIENAVQKKRFKIVEWFFPQGTVKEKFAFSLKLAVVGILATIAVIISLTTNQPNTVKRISNELLDWEGKKVITQINEIKNTINLIHEDEWDKRIMILDNKMQSLEKNADKYSFN